MSNFKFLLFDPGFVPFADVAMAAERTERVRASTNWNC